MPTERECVTRHAEGDTGWRPAPGMKNGLTREPVSLEHAPGKYTVDREQDPLNREQ